MVSVSKPPTGLSNSLTIHLPAFKRKRIEQWCEDVAQYLKAGSLCRSVIGHVVDDGRLPAATVKSAPASHQRTAAVPAINTFSALDLSITPVKKDSTNTNTKGDSTLPSGRGTPMPDTSGPLPVVKFSYSHYNEQRRRTDRLVQGLPASAAANSAVDRLVASGTVVYTNGDESLKTPGLGAMGSKVERSNSRSSCGETRQRASFPSHLSRHHSLSPSPSKTPHPTSSSQPHVVVQGTNKMSSSDLISQGVLQGSSKVTSSEIVVIEDDLPGHTYHADTFSSKGLRSLQMNGLKRSQSLKVQKARQRMMAGTRRSDHNSHTHVPVQSCWAMAELTW